MSNLGPNCRNLKKKSNRSINREELSSCTIVILLLHVESVNTRAVFMWYKCISSGYDKPQYYTPATPWPDQLLNVMCETPTRGEELDLSSTTTKMYSFCVSLDYWINVRGSHSCEPRTRRLVMAHKIQNRLVDIESSRFYPP